MQNHNTSSDGVKEKKRSRTIAIVLGFSVIINLLFLTYAFVQKSEAHKQRVLAKEYQNLTVQLHDHEQEVINSLRTEIDSIKNSCK